jgi:enamine deaminase RidA (YjgF/YER057c/UK114 family)
LYAPAGQSDEVQVTSVLELLAASLAMHGSDFRHMAKATYYVSTSRASGELNRVRPIHYDPKRPPAASKAMVSGVGFQGRSIVVDMIATGSGSR